MQDHFFVHIPATAGMAVRTALGTRRVHVIHDLARNHYQRPGVQWEQRFKFTFVRNPFDRAVSICAKVYECKDETWLPLTTFKQWVKDGMPDTQVSQYADSPRMSASQREYLTDTDGEWLVDFVGRYETLDADAERVCRHLGIPACAVPWKNVSARDRDYHAYYDDVTRERVAERYIDDLQEWEYTF